MIVTSLQACVAAAVIHAVAATARVTPHLKVIQDVPLPPTLHSAMDVRWADDDEIFVANGRDGVHRLRLTNALTVLEAVIEGEKTRKGFFFSSRLAVSDEYLVPASSFAAFAWKARSKPASDPIDGTRGFAVIVDIDSYGDEVLILGADRDDDGEWAPEGAIAWRGSVRNRGRDLRPVHYSSAGPKVAPMNNCGILEMGAVRFMRDGSFVVVPGVEPGVFLYDATGKLKRTWPTAGLGFEDRCKLTFEEGAQYRAKPEVREAWMDRHTVLDDVIALPSGPGLILRSYRDRTTRWSLLAFSANGETRKVVIPITSASRLAHLRADVRGDSIVALVLQYGPVGKPKLEAPRVIRMKMHGF